MADFPHIQGQRSRTIGTVEATTFVTLGSGAVNNVKGTYSLIVTRTPYDADGFFLETFGNVSTRNHRLDLVKEHAAGSAMLLTDYFIESSRSELQSTYIPIKIPAESSLSARIQTNTAATDLNVALNLLNYGFTMPSGLQVHETWGLTAGVATTPTTVDAGAVANTKGSWTPLVSSTTRNVRAFTIVFSTVTNISAISSLLVDIGIGASGSEQVIIPNIPIGFNNGEDKITPARYGPISLHIPAGSRISARAQASTTTAANRQCGIVIHAFS